MKIALAQINTTVGAFVANAAKVRQYAIRAASQGADLVVFPELTLPGYPPLDLLDRPAFVARNLAALDDLARFSATIDAALLVGFAAENPDDFGKPLYNAVALLEGGELRAIRYKTLLPTYDVFDEARHFEPAERREIMAWRGHRLGVCICEDAWNSREFWEAHLYELDPVRELAEQGAQVIINVSASPFHRGKSALRRAMLAHHAAALQLPVVLVNQVGGNDSLVFDGRSMVLDARGELVLEANAFEEDLRIVDLANLPSPITPKSSDEIGDIHDALVLGVRDYLAKCGFRQAVIGLSGGIDSAVTAAIAVRALGRENVTGVAMPSKYSSQHSLEDAAELARNLGIAFHVVPIEPAVEAMMRMLTPAFGFAPHGVTEENIQARLRGLTLMAFSNQHGCMVLTTGNKSELAVGYCTLYGDMCGGLAVISDVPKTDVYRLAAYINRHQTIIPTRTITKPPSAELRPNQTDQDSLPPYDLLDAILERYIERYQSVQEIIADGFEPAVVEQVVKMVNRNEYKRQQAAPGIKVTPKAFGRGRRVPIAAVIED
ncbi:MAG: NAD+ synthase [Chloracidobacterium sp.]|nr:NAD+ synthase [Chloracidobacterium sp.]MDW8218052.1 NAD+ synthase [Acidobacteriota bacterium]